MPANIINTRLNDTFSDFDSFAFDPAATADDLDHKLARDLNAWREVSSGYYLYP